MLKGLNYLQCCFQKYSLGLFNDPLVAHSDVVVSTVLSQKGLNLSWEVCKLSLMPVRVNWQFRPERKGDCVSVNVHDCLPLCWPCDRLATCSGCILPPAWSQQTQAPIPQPWIGWSRYGKWTNYCSLMDCCTKWVKGSFLFDAPFMLNLDTLGCHQLTCWLQSLTDIF